MGSFPAALPIPGIESAKNSDDVLAMRALPKSAVIIGGGVIGVEFATLMSSLDVEGNHCGNGSPDTSRHR